MLCAQTVSAYIKSFFVYLSNGLSSLNAKIFNTSHILQSPTQRPGTLETDYTAELLPRFLDSERIEGCSECGWF